MEGNTIESTGSKEDSNIGAKKTNATNGRSSLASLASFKEEAHLIRSSVATEADGFAAHSSQYYVVNNPRSKMLLDDGIKLVRTLFWAFEDLEAQGDGDVSDLEISFVAPNTLRKRVERLVNQEAFGLFYMVLTFYALFGPDILLSCGHAPQSTRNPALGIVNTIVFFLFIVEQVLHCWAIDGYLFSLRFWIDTLATLSLVGDTWIAAELFQSDALAAGRGSRLLRLIRMGGRSGRLVRLLRIARLTQILRLMPKLQRWMERSTHDLALLLWHKRIKHVFSYFDSDSNGELDAEELLFFRMAMDVAFPDPKGQSNAKVLKSSATKAVIQTTSEGSVASIQSMIEEDCSSYTSFATKLFRTPVGKRSYNRCMTDIQCMKESCAIVQKSISRMTLKICVMVLALLVVMQLLEINQEDIAISQAFKQFDMMANDPDVSKDVICQLIKDTYTSTESKATLELLILQNRLYWESSCQCCAVAANKSVSDIVKTGRATVDASPNERHELLSIYLANGPDLDEGELTGVVVFDIHSEVRSRAVAGFVHTFVVVLLLLALVLFFASDLSELSSKNVLHPLWTLMDDMCALKSVEILNEKNKGEEDLLGIIRRHRSNRRCKSNRQIPVADELLQLRTSFNNLLQALRSWSKYVPIVLLKQLLDAGIEAKIGCTPKKLSILFCDIARFQDVCDGMSPKEVLELLSVVLDGVHQAIADHGGTLLEFIGDEVLAIFNAPKKITEHHKHAMYAALDAIEHAANLPNNPGVRLQCSVHRARVLCGNLGSPTRMKYGVLGDGVNMTARLKSLNTRYNTQLLISGDAVELEECTSSASLPLITLDDSADEELIMRSVGNLVLKGRTTPTKVIEILGKRRTLSARQIKGADLYQSAFDAYTSRSFAEAKKLFEEAHDHLTRDTDGGLVSPDDRPTKHHIGLCDQYMSNPPPANWDGSEVLKKKAW